MLLGGTCIALKVLVIIFENDSWIGFSVILQNLDKINWFFLKVKKLQMKYKVPVHFKGCTYCLSTLFLSIKVSANIDISIKWFNSSNSYPSTPKYDLTVRNYIV